MRAHHAFAVVAVIVVGFVLKLTFLSAPISEASVGSVTSANIDISQVHQHLQSLPVEKLHDMTFVFSDGDSHRKAAQQHQ